MVLESIWKDFLREVTSKLGFEGSTEFFQEGNMEGDILTC